MKPNLGLQFCCNAKIARSRESFGLDARCCVRKENRMTIRLTSAAAVALLALSACDSKPTEVSTVAPDPMASVLANKAPIELPPSIKAEETFRCKDNSLVFVAFFQGDKQALIRETRTSMPVKLTAEKAGDPLIADGYVMTGDTKAVTLTQPGKPTQLCDR